MTANKTQGVKGNIEGNQLKKLRLQAAKQAISTGVLSRTGDGRILDLHGNVMAASSPLTRAVHLTQNNGGGEDDEEDSEVEETRPSKRRKLATKPSISKKTPTLVSTVRSVQNTVSPAGSSAVTTPNLLEDSQVRRRGTES